MLRRACSLISSDGSFPSLSQAWPLLDTIRLIDLDSASSMSLGAGEEKRLQTVILSGAHGPASAASILVQQGG